MKFHLRIYDNFQYMDESAAYNSGQFDTYAEAVVAAKGIVKSFFVDNWKTGELNDKLPSNYTMFGEDPVVLPNEHGEQPRFSAWTYADEVFETMCKTMPG